MKIIKYLFVLSILSFIATGFAQENEMNSLCEDYETFIVKGVSFSMRFVEGGTFTMGATSEQGVDGEDDEKPIHKVTLSNYYICTTEVTQELWTAVMGKNPSTFKGDSQCPVESVTWYKCQEFIDKLNLITGKKFRLPTEAEWEFAARGGNLSKGYKYAGSDKLSSVAWYQFNSGDRLLYDTGNKDRNFEEYLRNNARTHAVGRLKPNELGLYDMSGNVREWCYGHYYDYEAYPQTNPNGINEDDRSFPQFPHRGGSYAGPERWCRVSARNFELHYWCDKTTGLRLAMSDTLDKSY